MPPVNRQATLLAALRRWNATHPSSQDIDEDAALRVAGQEGLSGRIGDGGHAFGPFQLNDAGGVVTGKLSGSPAQRNEWAWSKPGLEYALSGLAHASGGKHGADAMHSIVYDFERPADPAGEYARAAGVSGGKVGGGGPAPLSAGQPAAAAPDNRHAFLRALLGAISPTGEISNQAGLVNALQLRRQQPVDAAWGTPGSHGIPSNPPASPTSPPGKPATFGPGIAELLREGTGGPTHSTGPHIHAAFNDPQLELAAISWAQQHGLHIGENPYVGDTVDPVHAPNSYHTRNFAGLFNGKKLGRAIDVSGPTSNAFYAYLAGGKR